MTFLMAVMFVCIGAAIASVFWLYLSGEAYERSELDHELSLTRMAVHLPRSALADMLLRLEDEYDVRADRWITWPLATTLQANVAALVDHVGKMPEGQATLMLVLERERQRRHCGGEAPLLWAAQQ
jgi:hypothetical protein